MNVVCSAVLVELCKWLWLTNTEMNEHNNLWETVQMWHRQVARLQGEIIALYMCK